MKKSSSSLFIVLFPLLLLALVLLTYHYKAPHPEQMSTNELHSTDQNNADNSNSDSANYDPLEDNKYTQAIKIGGEWFLNNQNYNFLYYEYNYVDQEHADKNHSMREMGALWSITMIADFLEDSRYDDLTEKGFAFFESFFAYDEENDFMYVNVTPHKIKLGYNAFMILTLLELEHPQKDEYLEKLAKGIIYQQNDDGELRTFFYSDRDTGKDYYPGEALVSLMALYEYTEDEQYLEVVKKAFPHYKDYFMNNRNTAFVPWQSRAYTKYYQATKDQEVGEFVMEMNDYMLEENRPQSECSDFAFPRGIVTAVFMEGVIHAYKVADLMGLEDKKQCYANFTAEAADYVITLQKNENHAVAKPGLGGFIGDKGSETMRVDRNQHALMALIEAYELGLLK